MTTMFEAQHKTLSFKVKCPDSLTAGNLLQLIEDSKGDEALFLTPLIATRHGSFANDVIWIRGRLGVEIKNLSAVLQEYLKDNDPHGSLAFSWAETFDKPVEDGFGGGAAVITADNIHWFHTGEFLYENRKG